MSCHLYYCPNKGQAVRRYSKMWHGISRWTEEASFHPTQKPVDLMHWILAKFCEPDDVVVDPYMGSAPVLIAAKLSGHRAIGIEIEEKYCEIAAKRLSQEVFDFHEPPSTVPTEISGQGPKLLAADDGELRK